MKDNRKYSDEELESRFTTDEKFREQVLKDLEEYILIKKKMNSYRRKLGNVEDFLKKIMIENNARKAGKFYLINYKNGYYLEVKDD